MQQPVSGLHPALLAPGAFGFFVIGPILASAGVSAGLGELIGAGISGLCVIAAASISRRRSGKALAEQVRKIVEEQSQK